ncbi:mitochondrial inner membrane protein required for protein import [Ascosphaera aggregata]|nr:mitochondrial inner membrane protein required for protein import [Ascosphaera aggregata]
MLSRSYSLTATNLLRRSTLRPVVFALLPPPPPPPPHPPLRCYYSSGKNVKDSSSKDDINVRIDQSHKIEGNQEEKQQPEREQEKEEEEGDENLQSSGSNDARLQDTLRNIPLPDLTKGLPSTIFTELEQQKRKNRPGLPNLTEDTESAEFDPANVAVDAGKGWNGGGRGSDGSGSTSEYVSSTDRRRDKMASVSYAFFWTSCLAAALYLGRNWSDEEEAKAHPDAPAGWSPQNWWSRLKARYTDITSYYADPPFPKLLPDEDPALRQPYTLVLSLEDLLIHNEWTREHGWRLAKRPGVDYFLRYLNQYFELVLFTSVPVMQADQVLRKLDPFRIIRWPLGREAARYEKGEYIKDLSYLNRDLSKVIVIDTNPAHVKSHPENAIILPKWTGNPQDKDLVALIPFLEYIAGVGIEDVRTVIKSFEGTHIPTEFLRREKIMRQKHAERVAEELKHRPKRSVGGIASLLGMKPAATMADSVAGDSDKMILDLIRERGQKNYEFMDREIKENGPKWLAEMEAEEEKVRQMQMQRCSFYTPHGHINQKNVFKLLVLADPQLEGDTSLPHPDLRLRRRIAWHWRRIHRAARKSIRGVADTTLQEEGDHDADPFDYFTYYNYFTDEDLDQYNPEDIQSESNRDSSGSKYRNREKIVLSLQKTISKSLHALFRKDIPRSLEGIRKRLDLLGNDFYLAHIYRTLHAHTRPTHVTVLGDLLGSQWIDDEEFKRRSDRYWRRVFRGAEKVAEGYMITGDVDQGHSENGTRDAKDKVNIVAKISADGWDRRLINIAGNHDIGYAGDLSEKRLDRFEKTFGRANWDIFFELDEELDEKDDHDRLPAPSIHLINLNDMLLDGPTLSDDLQRKTYAYLNDVISRSPAVGDNTTFTLLLTHVPLYKPEGICTDAPHITYFDSDDHWNRFRQGGLKEQNLLGDYISYNGILQGIFGMSGEKAAPARGRGRNGLILNGHDHTGCDTVHYIHHEGPDPASTQADNQDLERLWSWKNIRYSSENMSSYNTPNVREITLPSMMGEYGGNAGFLTIWFDDGSSSSSSSLGAAADLAPTWKYKFTRCRFGIQHIWWAVHVLALIATANLLLWIRSSILLMMRRRADKRQLELHLAQRGWTRGRREKSIKDDGDDHDDEIARQFIDAKGTSSQIDAYANDAWQRRRRSENFFEQYC